MDVPSDLNTTSNTTLDHSIEDAANFYTRLFLELFTVTAAISLTANILIIFVISKYTKLRRSTTNVFILHLNILQAVYMFCTPLTIRLFVELKLVERVHARIFCVLNDLELGITFGVLLFLILLGFDWYLKLYYEERHRRFANVYHFFVVVVYIVLIFICAVTTQMCVRDIPYFSSIFPVILGYIFIIIFAVVLNVIHLFKRRRLQANLTRNNVGLALLNIFVLLWCPFFVVLVLATFGLRVHIALIVSVTMGFLGPPFNLGYLYWFDRDFNVFFEKVFRCQCNEYKNEDLDNLDRTVSFNGASGVTIYD